MEATNIRLLVSYSFYSCFSIFCLVRKLKAAVNQPPEPCQQCIEQYTAVLQINNVFFALKYYAAQLAFNIPVTLDEV